MGEASKKKVSNDSLEAVRAKIGLSILQCVEGQDSFPVGFTVVFHNSELALSLQSLRNMISHWVS